MSCMNILIVGVGGQGTLLAARVIGNTAAKCGYDVKVSEVHGMSQRGGSVVTYVRFGEKVHSPTIDRGEADVILAFEKLEALRWIGYLKKDGILVMNNQQIDPMPVIAGKAEYPKNITERLLNAGIRAELLDASEIASRCGNIKAANVVLVGRMARLTAIGAEVWREVIRETVPPKFRDINIQAFNRGYQN